MPVPAIKLAIPEQSNEFVANIAGATYVQLAGTTLDTVGAMDTYAINATGGEDGRTFLLNGEIDYYEDGLQAGLAVAEQLGGVRRPWLVPNPSGRIVLDVAEPAADRELVA